MRVTFQTLNRVALRSRLARRIFPLTLTQWYGRLGNNIQQVCMGILFAMNKGGSFHAPPHPQIGETSFRASRWKRFLPSLRNRFFFHMACPTEAVLQPDFELDYTYICDNLHEVARRYVAPALRVPGQPPLGEDTLVVHIRGGDLFAAEGRVSPDYVQNPLAFFEMLIDRFERTILVVEPGEANPVVPILAARPDVVVQSESVEQDFATLMSARNLASSGVGTFCVAAALCSPNLRDFYCSDRYLTEHLNPDFLDPKRVEVHVTRLDGYIKIGEWNSRPETIDRMLTYRL